jgi:calcium/calmodulin-dependent protein kinase (CaM kinase) II
LENLLLDKEATDFTKVKLSDFGLSKELSAGSLASECCGTLTYCAPEVLSKKPYGFSCDFWSIGVVLYILLNGYHPFYEDDDLGLAAQIQAADYDKSTPEWLSMSGEARDLIESLLTVDPSRRITGEGILKHPWISAAVKKI